MSMGPASGRSVRVGLILGGLLVVGLIGGILAVSSTSQPARDQTGSPIAAPIVQAECDLSGGEPYVGGSAVSMSELGISNGVRVEGAVYPRPDYEGKPWSQWGQGIVLPDGRFISAIGDQLGPDGNSYLFEYDPSTGRLETIGDVLSYVEHEPGTWGYGKIHSQMVPGPCGEVYFSTYWGSYRGLRFEGEYRGDILFRLDPYGRTLAPLGVPVDLQGQASLASSPADGLVFGEAVDPILKAEGVDQGPLFVYDIEKGEVVFLSADTPHVGYRSIAVDSEGRAYYSIGGGQLAVYDPDKNRVETHPESMPGDWLRAVTVPGPDGSVYGVTREPDTFFVLRPDGEIEVLGSPPAYTTSLALSPDGSRFFYMPGAHGVAWKFGGALTMVDTSTGRQEVVVELNQLVEKGLGLTVGGTYNVAVSPDGRTVYMGINASPVGDDSGFGEVALLVIHLP